MVYPNIPSGFGLVRLHFTDVGGTAHAYILHGVQNFNDHDAVTVASDTYAAWSGDILGAQADTYAFADVQATVNIGGVLSQGSHFGTDVGGSSSEALPPQVCALVQKRTALLGKHYRGRIYVPGYTMADVDTSNPGKWSSSFMSGTGPAFASYLSTLSGSDLGLVLLHRNTSIAPTTVTDLILEGTMATQRRRLRKAAHH